MLDGYARGRDGKEEEEEGERGLGKGRREGESDGQLSDNLEEGRLYVSRTSVTRQVTEHNIILKSQT